MGTSTRDRCKIMPQGKLKVKTKGGAPPAKKDKPAKKPAGVKKGKLVFAPKKTLNMTTIVELKLEVTVETCIFFRNTKTFTSSRKTSKNASMPTLRRK